MSGHNKWSTIKHKKGAADAKRGKIFTKITRELVVAAKEGGADPSSNARLRLAMSKARENNMPKDNVERAIKKGTGEIEGAEYSEFTFEGYGPSGVAILVEGMSDNMNRTAADVRSIFNKGNGNLGAQGSVAWMFEKKGQILIDHKSISEEKILDIGLNSGAEDVLDRGEFWEVLTQPADFEAVKTAIEGEKVPIGSADISMLPKNTVKLGLEDAK